MAHPLLFRLTLASGSRGRRYLMEQAGYTFDVKPSNVPEPAEAEGGDIRGYVQHVAWIKAAAVGPTVSDGIVISGDSVAWLDGKVVGKPEDEADARRILTGLSGRVHELWTGVCLWRCADGRQYQWQELSRVRMRALSGDEIEAYLKTDQWVGCSGAYSIAEVNDPFLTVETGTMSNVIGLPMESLAEALAEFGR